MDKLLENRWVQVPWYILLSCILITVLIIELAFRLRLKAFLLVACIVTTLMISCGGGGGSSSSDNNTNNPSDNQPTAVILSGTAAIGEPMSGGSVWLREADRTEHGPYPIDAAGNYFIDVTGFTPPFHIKACSAEGTTCLYSIATQEQHIANINPLTNWVVMKAAGVNDPEDVFDNPSLFSITEQELNDAIAEIQLELAGLLARFDITQNFLSDTYIANASDKLDDLFHRHLDIEFDFIAGKISFSLNGMYLGCDYIDDTENPDDPITDERIKAALAVISVSGSGDNGSGAMLTLENVTSSPLGGTVRFVDALPRLNFASTSITGVTSVDGGIVIITGEGAVTDISNYVIPGYTFTATVSNGTNVPGTIQLHSPQTVIGGDYNVTGSLVGGPGVNSSGSILNIENVTSSPFGGTVTFIDALSRLNFASTSITGVSVTDGAATITGEGEVTDISNYVIPGYTFTAIVTNGTATIQLHSPQMLIDGDYTVTIQ